MKLLFSLLLLCSLQVDARPIVLLTGQINKASEKMIYKVLTQKLGIPTNYITLDLINKHCKPNKDAVIQLCFKNTKFITVFKKDIVLKKTISRIMKKKS